MKKYFVYILLFLLSFSFGCATLLDTFVETTVDSTLYKTHKIVLEISGDKEKAEISYLTMPKRDVKMQTPKETAELGTSSTTNSTTEELKRDLKIRPLPFKQSFTITTGDYLYIYCRPFQANNIIKLKLTDNSKVVKENLLQPNNLGVYIDYVPSD